MLSVSKPQLGHQPPCTPDMRCEAIEHTLADDSVREATAARLIRRLRSVPDRGNGGKVSWTREEIHER